MNIPSEVSSLCENEHVYISATPGIDRIDEHRYLAVLGQGDDPRLRSFERIALSDVEHDVEDARAELRSRGFNDASWLVGPCATPADVASRLRDLGMVDHKDSPLTMLVLFGEPASASTGVEARRAETRGEEYKGYEIQNQVFNVPYTPDPVRRDSAVPVDTEERDVVVVAWDGTTPIAMGTLELTDLGAVLGVAGTLPAYRGRGAYRAVVSERCRLARERGLDWVVTQAGALSTPILERMGFERAGSIDVLIDRF